MNESLSMPAISSNSNLADFSLVNNCNNTIPPLPKKKQLQRAIVMEKKLNMNNLLVSAEKEEQSQARNVTEEPETEVPIMGKDGANLSEVELRTSSPEDHHCNGYLTPADPRIYQESSLTISDPDFNLGENFRRFLSRDKPILRLDSGVGDGESSQGSGSIRFARSSPVSATPSLCSSHLFTQYEQPYEDIDHYNRVNEHLYHPTHQLPQRSASGRPFDHPHTYMQLNTNKNSETSHAPASTSRCPMTVVEIAIAVMALFALLLSIITLILRLRSSLDCSETKQTLITMQQKTDDLIKKTSSSQLKNLSNTLALTNAKFTAEIANISFTPGPEGPLGIANFSLCMSQSSGRNAPASSSTWETPYAPSEIALQKYFVTFAYCTYSGATDAYLETQFDRTSARYRYRCKCWGQVYGVTSTQCTLIIWMCPQEI